MSLFVFPCPACGEQCQWPDRFCPSCGAAVRHLKSGGLPTPSPAVPVGDVTRHALRSRAIVLAVLVVVTALIAIGAFA